MSHYILCYVINFIILHINIWQTYRYKCVGEIVTGKNISDSYHAL